MAAEDSEQLAEIGIGMIIVLLGICYMFFVNPQIQFGLTIGIFFASIFALSIPNVLIGGCSMMTMSCRRTAFPALNVISTFVLIGSVANLVYLANEEPRSKLLGIEDFSLKYHRMQGNKSPAPPVFRSKLRGIKPNASQ